MITRTYEETMKFIFGVEDEAQINAKTFRSTGARGCGLPDH